MVLCKESHPGQAGGLQCGGVPSARRPHGQEEGPERKYLQACCTVPWRTVPCGYLLESLRGRGHFILVSALIQGDKFRREHSLFPGPSPQFGDGMGAGTRWALWPDAALSHCRQRWWDVEWKRTWWGWDCTVWPSITRGHRSPAPSLHRASTRRQSPPGPGEAGLWQGPFCWGALQPAALPAVLVT